MYYFVTSVHIRCLHHLFLGRLHGDGNCWWIARKSHHPLFWYVTNCHQWILECTNNFST